jgi:hypothetical protein
MKRKIYNLLLKSFEIQLPKKDLDHLNRVLHESDSLRKTKTQIEQIRHLLDEPGELNFKPRFTDHVIAKIRQLRDNSRTEFFESLKWAFRPLAISAIMLILGLMSFYAIDAHESFLSGIEPFPEPSLEQAMDPVFVYFQE